MPDFLNLPAVNTTVPSEPVVPLGVPEINPLHCALTVAPLIGLFAGSVIFTVACTFLAPGTLMTLSEMDATRTTLARVGCTVTDTELLAVAPRLSVTVSVAVKVPAAEYVCETVAPLPDVPSPKFH